MLSVVLLVVCGAYLFVASGRVYATRGFLRLLQSVVLTVAVVVIFLGYRFTLLPFTLYTT
ncbi:hypothetical protein D3C83_63170 [compost metagenome]